MHHKGKPALRAVERSKFGRTNKRSHISEKLFSKGVKSNFERVEIT
jgi:hypothetical protein